MGSTSFKNRDLNRWKKTYPFVKRTPRWAYFSDLGFQMEVGVVNFTFDDDPPTKTYIFDCPYPPPPAFPPVVTAVAVNATYDDATGLWTQTAPQPNVNVPVFNTCHTQCELHLSNTFHGSVMLHVMWIESFCGS